MERGLSRGDLIRTVFFVLVLSVISGAAFVLGFSWSGNWAHAQEDEGAPSRKPIVYPKKTQLDFEGTEIQGEIRNPGEFYFQRRPEEKFGSLVQRRKEFHREMLRDVVMGR